jgi:hypothetical protein
MSSQSEQQELANFQENIKNLYEILNPISKQIVKMVFRNFLIYEHNKFNESILKDSQIPPFEQIFSNHLYERIKNDEKLRTKLQTLFDKFIETVCKDNEFEEIFLSELNKLNE